MIVLELIEAAFMSGSVLLMNDAMTTVLMLATAGIILIFTLNICCPDS